MFFYEFCLAMLFVFMMLDFAYYGRIASALKVWPSLTDYSDELVLIDSGGTVAIIEIRGGSVVDDYVSGRCRYRSIVVTSKRIIFKNTDRTYRFSIPVAAIESYAFEEKMFSKCIIIDDKYGNIINVYPRNVERWVEVLTSLDVVRC
ncbi:MAG: hypothetical protein OET90_01485 [Desulfuromonadales bacterium]|nr:hypothetical protein [Desulfuromonadales bacterium]